MGKIITVTREFGSMGRQIARRVAEKLNFEYYDRNVLDIVAKEFRSDILELEGFEDKEMRGLNKMLYPLGLGSAKRQAEVFEMQKSVILDLASSEKNCVIVGRCSDYLLHEAKHKELLSVFIYAPYEARVESSQRELFLSESEAKYMIDGVDKARKDFYKLNTKESFYSNKYRHIMLDSSSMPHEDCAELIANAARARFHI